MPFLILILTMMFLPLQAAAQGGAVASAHPLATQAGYQILAQGGNAFDAAVAVSSVLAVVEPAGSGIGGGGFWLLYHSDQNRSIMVDAREVAPMASTADMYLDQDGHVMPRASKDGPLATPKVRF